MGSKRTSVHPQQAQGRKALASGLACALAALSLAACGGGDDERQDANEPEGDYPVEVTQAKFAARQRLAATTDLVLEIENDGDETVPELAVTISTGDEPADGPFNIRSEQQGLADPNRPVWILEQGYPKVLEKGLELADLDEAPPAGAETSNTNTYGFGPLEPAESLTAVWRVTPVKGGTYTVRYVVAAGLDGKARAVDANGEPVEGEFVATISTKPPATHVTDSGDVVPVD